MNRLTKLFYPKQKLLNNFKVKSRKKFLLDNSKIIGYGSNQSVYKSFDSTIYIGD
jgi:hypothetical protein